MKRNKYYRYGFSPSGKQCTADIFLVVSGRLPCHKYVDYVHCAHTKKGLNLKEKPSTHTCQRKQRATQHFSIHISCQLSWALIFFLTASHSPLLFCLIIPFTHFLPLDPLISHSDHLFFHPSTHSTLYSHFLSRFVLY